MTTEHERIVMCDYCMDEDGKSVFPYYGLAPHKHDIQKTGSFIGSTIISDKKDWPSNFFEDPECEGLGTYAFCPVCGTGSN